MTWFPNFSQYSNQTRYAEGLKLILPNAALEAAEEKNRLWETMVEHRLKYNTIAEMWGFFEG